MGKKEKNGSEIDQLFKITRKGICTSDKKYTQIFSPAGENKKVDERKAKKVCVTCPVYKACSFAAIRVSTHDVPGFLGGYTDKQRTTLRKLIKKK